MDVDPHDYTVVPRTVLEVPFFVEEEDVLGYGLDLYVGEATLPWMTTRWDRIWGIEELDLSLPIYTENFGTYGHWPPSLPRVAAGEQSAVGIVSGARCWCLAHLRPSGWWER